MPIKTTVSVLLAGFCFLFVISVSCGRASPQGATPPAGEKSAEKKPEEKPKEGTAPADGAAKSGTPGADKDSKTPPKDPSVGGPAADPQTTGAVEGSITLDGKPPELKPLVVDANNKDRPVCGAEIPNERLILGPGNTVTNAVVSLAKLPPGEKPPKRTIALDNAHCRFVPHVQATTIGSTIRITNQDAGVLHSAMAVLGAQFNVSVSTDKPVEKPLPRPGRVVIKCAVHSWMDASVWVFPHEFFAVSSKEGKFRIGGIPPGTYQLKVEHEACEDILKEFTVEAGKTSELKVGLKPYE